MPNYRQLARRYAEQYGIDPDLFERQINAESGFQTGRTSGAGAQGIAQIMPATARGWGVDPNDPEAALRASAQHMAEYARQYGGYRNALVAYNAGPGRVGGSLPQETRDYINKIMGGDAGSGGSPVTPSATPAGVGGGVEAPNLYDTLGALQPTPRNPLEQTMAENWKLMAAIERRNQSGQAPGMGGPTQPVAPTGAGGQTGEVGTVADLLANKFGLNITSTTRSPQQNAAAGGSPTSLHMSGRAADLSGNPQAMAKAFRYVEQNYPNVAEAFYDPIGHYLKRGKRVPGAIGGHGDHLHVAF